jgi:hypothetical protein
MTARYFTPANSDVSAVAHSYADINEQLTSILVLTRGWTQ